MSPNNNPEHNIHGRPTNDPAYGRQRPASQHPRAHQGPPRKQKRSNQLPPQSPPKAQPASVTLDGEQLSALTDAIVARLAIVDEKRKRKRATKSRGGVDESDNEEGSDKGEGESEGEGEDDPTEPLTEEEEKLAAGRKKLAARRDAIAKGRGFMSTDLKDLIEKQVVNHIDLLYTLARNHEVDPAIVLAEAGFNEWYGLSIEGPGTRKGISTPWTVFRTLRGRDPDMQIPKTSCITERNRLLAERQQRLSEEYQAIKEVNGDEYAALKAAATKATDDKIDKYRDTLWDGTEAKEPLWSAVEARKLRDENIRRFQADMTKWVCDLLDLI